jgi:hypothetical protein
VSVALCASGVDSLSLAWRPSSQRWWDLALAERTRPTGGGGRLFERRGPGDTRIVAWPAHGVVALEGRADALLTGTSEAWALRPKQDLAAAEDVGLEAIQRLAGTDAFKPRHCVDAEVRRYDLTVEWMSDTPAEGLAMLGTLGAMVPAGRKTDVWRGTDGQPQTVYFRTTKRGVVTERFYDKGVESGSHAPGLRIRGEIQRRPPKARRMRAAVLAGQDLSGDFGRSLEPYAAGNESVVVAGTDGALHHLAQKAASGELGIAKAERMIGSVALLREFGRAFYPDVQQQQRRLRDLREVGVALDVELPSEAVIPVGALLREAVERFSV